MLRKPLIGLFGALSLLATAQSQAAVVDTVTQVSSCGNTVIIHMANAGWVYASVNGAGAAQTQALYTIAIELLQTGHQTRFFYAAPTSTLICGVNAQAISDIGIKDPDRT